MTISAMLLGDVIFAAPDWSWRAGALAALATGALGWSYWRSGSAGWAAVAAAALKGMGLAALIVCLVEPLFSGSRPRPQSNLFLLAADNSRSLEIHDPGNRRTRGETMQRQLAEKAGWRIRLAQDFDVRPYIFDSKLQSVRDYTALNFQGDSSSPAGSLERLAERFRGRPVAGILLFTDGNATDLVEQVEWRDLPPVYPVVLGADASQVDVGVSRVSVSQTNFEAAPVTIAAEIQSQGLAGRSIVVSVTDESGKVVERRTIKDSTAGKPSIERFLLRPERPGVSFYSVQAALEGEDRRGGKQTKSAEATLLNNRRLATVDRGGGPYRVLYVSGRPNWEFKFLRRALAEDEEVNLLGLVRIAKKEPKFTFRGRSGESTNPLFRGFGNQTDEQAEQYNEPVLLRLGIEDKDELKGGFPKSAEELFAYHAIVLDDVEAGFFTHEQMSLVQQFVSQRGGGFLMLGGLNAFAKGGYQRTPIAELLPVYLDRSVPPVDAEGEGLRLLLTREGWLQPWVRLRATEEDETQRLADMPPFKVLSGAAAIQPGAADLARAGAVDGAELPALVVQQFGRGRSAALTVGDWWRWNLRRKEVGDSDLEKAWRQLVRWLVADVPKRVEVETQREGDDASRPVEIVVRVRDKSFEPLDNASVAVRVKTPDGREIELAAEPSQRSAGEYRTSFASRSPGGYLASVVAKEEDGSEIGRREAGWAIEPAPDELRSLQPNRALLERVAMETSGEIVDLDRLDDFVADLPNRKIPVVEAWTYPLWHQWTAFVFAIGCLAGEWGLRRWKGLP